jgi:hypothetical protein
VPTFVVATPKVVVPTVLAGFTVKTFTRGIRYAYTRAFMRRFSITDARRVIITNIRMRVRGGGATRRLDEAQQRVLAAASGVAFDIQVSANTTTAAAAFKATVKGGNTAQDAAILADFKAEIVVVGASGEYGDVTTSYVLPSQLAVVTEQAVVGLATGMPTPAPTPATAGDGDGAKFPVVPVAAVGALFALAAFAGLLRRRNAGLNRAKRSDRREESEDLDCSVQMREDPAHTVNPVYSPGTDDAAATPSPLDTL